MSTYYQGDTAVLDFTVTNEAGSLVDPTSLVLKLSLPADPKARTRAPTITEHTWPDDYPDALDVLDKSLSAAGTFAATFEVLWPGEVVAQWSVVRNGKTSTHVDRITVAPRPLG